MNVNTNRGCWALFCLPSPSKFLKRNFKVFSKLAYLKVNFFFNNSKLTFRLIEIFLIHFDCDFVRNNHFLHGVVVRAFVLYWGGNRFESLSTHHCWALSKSSIPSLMAWSVTKIKHFAEKSKNKKSNGEQSDLCDLEQVTLKPQLQVHHYLTTWLQIWYNILLWGDSNRKGTDLKKNRTAHSAPTPRNWENKLLWLKNWSCSIRNQDGLTSQE